MYAESSMEIRSDSGEFDLIKIGTLADDGTEVSSCTDDDLWHHSITSCLKVIRQEVDWDRSWTSDNDDSCYVHASGYDVDKDGCHLSTAHLVVGLLYDEKSRPY